MKIIIILLVFLLPIKTIYGMPQMVFSGVVHTADTATMVDEVAKKETKSPIKERVTKQSVEEKQLIELRELIKQLQLLIKLLEAQQK